MYLHWTEEAKDDLTSIRRYIATDNPGAARAVVESIIASTLKLVSHPNLGRPGRVENTQELVIPGLPYIIPYQIRGGTIFIIRVYHTSCKWPQSFE